MIKNLFKQIISYFKRSEKIELKEKEDLESIGGITFKLNSDSTIDISCYIPETKNLSVEQMTTLSENYAELMLYINEGFLTPKIIEFIKGSIKETDFEQDKLFFENVLVFCTMHHVEHLKNKKAKSNQPLIRPSSVFSQ